METTICKNQVFYTQCECTIALYHGKLRTPHSITGKHQIQGLVAYMIVRCDEYFLQTDSQSNYTTGVTI